jgi:hypothetical protein
MKGEAITLLLVHRRENRSIVFMPVALIFGAARLHFNAPFFSVEIEVSKDMDLFAGYTWPKKVLNRPGQRGLAGCIRTMDDVDSWGEVGNRESSVLKARSPDDLDLLKV